MKVIILCILLVIQSTTFAQSENDLKVSQVCKLQFIPKSSSGYIVELEILNDIEFEGDPAVGLYAKDEKKILLVCSLSTVIIEGQVTCSFNIDRSLLLKTQILLRFKKKETHYLLEIKAEQNKDGDVLPQYKLKVVD